MTFRREVVLASDVMIAANTGTTPAVLIGDNRGYGRYRVSVVNVSDSVDEQLLLELLSADTPTDDNGWVLVGSCLLQGSTQTELVVTACRGYLRVRWTLPGLAPAAVFSVKGVTEQLYCTPEDVARLSLPPVTLALIPQRDLGEACLAATDEAVSYLGSHYDLPLTGWGHALTMHTANMAAYHAMRRRGFSPDADETIRLGYTDALEWLKSGARTDGAGILDSTPTNNTVAVGADAYLVGRPSRGWSYGGR